MSRISKLLTALLLLAPVTMQAQEPPEPPDPPPEIGVWRAKVAGLNVIETVLPEVPIAAAPWPSGGLAVLTHPLPEEDDDESRVEEDELPRALYRVRGEASDLEPIARDLPPEIDSVHHAGGQFWLGGEDSLWRLGEDGQLILVLEASGINLDAMARGGLFADDLLWVPDVGRLRHHRFDGELELLSESPLPTSARRRRRRLILRSPTVTRLADGTLIAGPEAAGKTRVKHLILSQTSEDGQAIEAWSRMPGPEDVDRHWYSTFNGEPVFLAATTEANRLGVFEKLKLRIFRLRADRTRAGRTPVLAVESETFNWYDFEPKILDWNGDDRDDLALIQPDGMGPGNLVIELYVGRNGRFNPKPRRTKIDAESATWNLGEDFDGDGMPELVVGTGQLAIHRGIEHRRKVIEKKAWKTVSPAAIKENKREIIRVEEDQPTTEDRPSFRGRVRIDNFIGDAKNDIAVVRRFEGRAVVRLITLPD